MSRVTEKVFFKQRGHVSRAKTKPTTSIRVAFMGDGTFGHHKGHAPVPKKKLAKVLATKGVTLMLDEFYTSRECPCGDSKLVDNLQFSPNANCRPRCHETVGPGGPCCVEHSLGGGQKMDRDVLAIVNFLLCASAALKGGARPRHLCRPEWITR